MIVITRAGGPPLKVAFIGSIDRRPCGVAEFTRELADAVVDVECDTEVGVIDDGTKAATFIENLGPDVVSLQYDASNFGGEPGRGLLDVLERRHVPVVTTLHTLSPAPTGAQYRIMEVLGELSTRFVVMCRQAVRVLESVYHVEPRRVDLIHHGIPDVPFADPELHKPDIGLTGRRIMLTFGPIGPGEGLEHAIRALPAVVEQHPEVVYMIAGSAPHDPGHVRDLERLAERLGVGPNVMIHDRFVSPLELRRFVAAAEICVNAYPRIEQVSSAALAYAVGAGRAVVSTPTWYAQELLAGSRGMLVPVGDPAALAATLIQLLEDPQHRERLGRRAYVYGRRMLWPEVARRYLKSFRAAAPSKPPMAHSV